MKLTAVLATLGFLGFAAARSLPSISPRAITDTSPIDDPVHNDIEAHKDRLAPTLSPGGSSPSRSPQNLPLNIPPPFQVHDDFEAQDDRSPSTSFPTSLPNPKSSPQLGKPKSPPWWKFRATGRTAGGESSPTWSVESSHAIAPDVRRMFEECYDFYDDEHVFHGILPDTGAPEHSIMPHSQFKALQQSNPKITLDRTKAGAAKPMFGQGDVSCSSIGSTHLKTPFGKMTFHVVDASTPTILSYRDMRAHGLEVRHKPSRLVKVDESGNVLKEAPLVTQFQHPWYRPCVRTRCSLSSLLPRICTCMGHRGVPGSPDPTPRESQATCNKGKPYVDNDQLFYGIVPDTGNTSSSLLGHDQFKALQRIKPDITLDRTKAGAVTAQFGPEAPCTSIGLARVPTRFGKMKFHVLDAPILAYLSYRDMRDLGLEVRHRPEHRLVKVDKSGKIIDEAPLFLQAGHPSYHPWDDSTSQPGPSYASTTPPGSPVRSEWASKHEPNRIQHRGLVHDYHRRLKI